MDSDLYSRLKYELLELKNRRENLSTRLGLLEHVKNKKLRVNIVDDNHSYYYIGTKNIKGFQYIGPGTDTRIMAVKEFVHIQEALDRIDENIGLITALLEGYLEHDPDTVDSALPAVYRFESFADRTALFGPFYSYGRYRRNALKWKADKLSFQAGFPENYPERKTERASDGTRLKTLSEVVIYERLLSAGLICIYELPFPSNDYGPNLYPDFTVLSPIDMKTEIIIEYAGRLDLPKYREDFAKRIYRYMQNGYIPGVNLFLVYGDNSGHVDSLQINKIIADIKGIR